MPLRDHFRPPVDVSSWEELHGGWPMVIVQHLRTRLPQGYVAVPRVHSGSQLEVDVAAFERDDAPIRPDANSAGGVAVAVWPETSKFTVDPETIDPDEYQVRIYDTKRGRQLVAAVEIVSPANKDRPEKRNSFLRKCAGLLRHGVSVSIVDLVTTRQFNLYAELLTTLGLSDPSLPTPAPAIYAASCRLYEEMNADADQLVVETKCHELIIGQPLPTIPLWLAPKLVIPLDLETTYEQACRDVSIP